VVAQARARANLVVAAMAAMAAMAAVAAQKVLQLRQVT